MQLENLIKPLNRLTDECYFTKELKDFLYLFESFTQHLEKYVKHKDADSFALLTMDEIACLDRFPETIKFMQESLMVFIDVMEVVKIDYLNHDNNEEEEELKKQMISKIIENIDSIIRRDAKRNESPSLKN